MTTNIQMELYGSHAQLHNLRELQSEIHRRDHGQLMGITDVDRIAFEWSQSLEIYECQGRVIYSWRSHFPHRFVASLSERFADIAVIASIVNLEEQLVGTYALRGNEQIASSWAPNCHVIPRRPGVDDIEDDDLMALISNLEEDDPIDEISVVHYQRALEAIGLQPLDRLVANIRVWRSPAWKPAADDWRQA